MSNIKEIILKAVNTICDPVKATLGTKGRTVLYNMYISDENKPYVTKDGASIAKMIRSEDGYENMVISVLRESSLKTMLSSGDGTTTTCIIAQNIIKNGFDLIDSGVSYYEIGQAIDEAVNDVKEYLLENTEYVSENPVKLKEIASISGNDKNIGETIYDIIKEIGVYGNIQVERSSYNETKVEITKGMKIHKGWIDSSMCNNIAKESFEADECYILVYKGDIRDHSIIFKYYEFLNSEGIPAPLVVFCDDISDQLLSRLRNIIMTTRMPLCIVPNDGYLDQKEVLRNDIAISTGAVVITQTSNFNPDNLGFAEKVIVRKNTTSIIGGERDEEMTQIRIEEIKNILESDRIEANTELSNVEKKFYQRRLANYAGGVAIIHVGGRTQVEINELKDRYDDAVLATEAAIREGISLGGGYTFVNCKEYLLNKINNITSNKQAYELVLNAIEEPFKQLLINSDLYSRKEEIKKSILSGYGYDLRTNSFIDKDNYKVYDPTAVLIDALTNGAAVAKSLLSIKEMVYEGIRKV